MNLNVGDSSKRGFDVYSASGGSERSDFRIKAKTEGRIAQIGNASLSQANQSERKSFNPTDLLAKRIQVLSAEPRTGQTEAVKAANSGSSAKVAQFAGNQLLPRRSSEELSESGFPLPRRTSSDSSGAVSVAPRSPGTDHQRAISPEIRSLPQAPNPYEELNRPLSERRLPPRPDPLQKEQPGIRLNASTSTPKVASDPDIDRIRRELQWSRFEPVDAAEVLTKANRTSLADIERRKALAEAKGELSNAKDDLANLKDLIARLAVRGEDRTDEEKRAYKYLYVKVADASSLVARMSQQVTQGEKTSWLAKIFGRRTP